MLQSTITVLGDPDTGKTAFRWKFALNNFIQVVDPVVDSSCSDRHLLDGVHHRVSLVEAVPDPNPGKRKPPDDVYVPGTMSILTSAGFLILYSVTSRESFERVRRYYDEIVRSVEAKQAGGRTVLGIGVPVVGNKSDLAEEEEGQRVVTRAEGEALAKELGCPFFETSVKTGLNVEEAVCEVLRSVVAARGREEDSVPVECKPEKEGGKGKRRWTLFSLGRRR